MSVDSGVAALADIICVVAVEVVSNVGVMRTNDALGGWVDLVTSFISVVVEVLSTVTYRCGYVCETVVCVDHCDAAVEAADESG